MFHSKTFFKAQWVVNGIFYLLDLFLFYIVANSTGYLMQDVWSLIHGYVYYSVWFVKRQVGKISICLVLIY